MIHTTHDCSTIHSTWLVVTHDDRPVYVTGSTPELGEWNPDKALKMKHSGRGKDAQRWCIHLAFPHGQEMEFKFLEKTEDGNVLWEADGNRVFTAEGGDTAIEWGDFRFS